MLRGAIYIAPVILSLRRPLVDQFVFDAPESRYGSDICHPTLLLQTCHGLCSRSIAARACWIGTTPLAILIPAEFCELTPNTTLQNKFPTAW